eukprot:gnl/Hemi2/2221_TR795_c0_g1_i1.p1 gnl/Hemi2/2221_TR795_c0_g1~~gnl/Hemi2/2221_TR795_c0_g1_i1.p1  ORF type:complete len:244 (+),score=85.95 gnl/Hemi2/2221_TR795_c0_g1_i1:38-769(+)
MAGKQPSFSDTASAAPRRPVWLFLGGAFNPVHAAHVQALVAAKRALEDRGWCVEAGCLAPAPHGYVQQKMARRPDGRTIAAGLRISLCNLATASEPWIRPVDRTFGSAADCARAMLPASADCCLVVGADRAVGTSGKLKWSKGGPLTVCIGRHGDTERVREAMRHAGLRDSACADSDPPRFVLAACELAPISSTLVRQRLQAAVAAQGAARQAVCDTLVAEGLLPRAAMDALLPNLDKLYAAQ